MLITYHGAQYAFLIIITICVVFLKKYDRQALSSSAQAAMREIPHKQQASVSHGSGS